MEIKGKRVLITGGRGFLGRHVRKAVERLTDAEAVVATGSAWDLRNLEVTDGYFSLLRPDLVFHLAAAVGGIQANRCNPATFFCDNLRMGLNVLDCCVHYQVKKLLIVGTSCSYPLLATSPLREQDIWEGYPAEDTAAYGLAKRALLTAAQAYRRQHDLVTVMPILANLYGPGDHYDSERSHVLPALVRRAEEAEEVLDVWGHPDTVREFLYVEDAAQALIEVMEGYDEPGPINVGTGQPTTIGDLAHKVVTASGKALKLSWNPVMPVGHPARWLDVSNIRQRLGWSARTSLEWGLARTFEDYKSRRAALPLSPSTSE